MKVFSILYLLAVVLLILIPAEGEKTNHYPYNGHYKTNLYYDEYYKSNYLRKPTPKPMDNPIPNSTPKPIDNSTPKEDLPLFVIIASVIGFTLMMNHINRPQ